MQFPIHSNLVEVDHPFLYLVVDRHVLEQLREVRGDELLRPGRHLLLLWQLGEGAIDLGELEVEAGIQGELLQLELDPLQRLHYLAQLLLCLLVAALTARVKAVPVLLNALLSLREQIDDPDCQVLAARGGAGLTLLVIDGVLDTFLVGSAELLLYEAVVAPLQFYTREGLLFARVEERACDQRCLAEHQYYYLRVRQRQTSKAEAVWQVMRNYNIIFRQFAIMITREKSWLSFELISLIAILAIMVLIKKQITQIKTDNEAQASFLLSLSTKLLEIQSEFSEAEQRRGLIADTSKQILGVYVSEQKKIKKNVEHLEQKMRMIFEDPYTNAPATQSQNVTLTSSQRLRNIQQSIKQHQILLDILQAEAKNQIRKERIRKFEEIALKLPYFTDEKRRNYWLMERGNMLNPLLEQNELQQIQKLYRSEEPRLEQTYNLTHYPEQLPFCIVVPSFNNAKHFRFEFNIQSILNQQYSNYHVVIIDDASQDSTGLLINRFLKRNSIPSSKVEVVINRKRVTAVPNIHLAITQFCKPNEVAFFVDGDDEIISRKAFQIFNAVYQARRPAVAYSISLEYWLANDMVKDGWSLPYKEEEKANNSYREVAQKISHLRSFRVDLYLEIKEQDLKDKNGEWFNSTYDEVICLPMLEMSCGNIEYIDEHLYFYAYGTGLNDRQVDDKLQYSIAQYVRKQMPKYQCLPKFAKQKPLLNSD